MYLDQQKYVHTRQIYSILDLLGDLGGVLEVLLFVAGLFILPLSEFSFNLKALSLLYMGKTSNPELFRLPKKVKILKNPVPAVIKSQSSAYKEI